MARSGGGVRVEGLNEKVRALERAGVEVTDLKGVFGEIAADAARLASSFAPRRSGKLAASIKGNKAKSKAVVKAGGARTPYAGPINYGWTSRNIAPSKFMQRADEAISPTVVPRLTAALMRQKGLA
jgi:hypothetical protein